MAQKDKKKWKQPKLVVLVRNHPEDAVLAYCKDGGTRSESPTPFTGMADWQWCCSYSIGGGSCGNCNSLAVS
jgi:hypothetical protein